MAETQRRESTRCLRIGVFLPVLEGGGERVMLDLAEGLRRQGHAVDLVTAAFQEHGPFTDWIHPEMNVVNLNAISVVSRLRALARYLSSAQPDALITFYDFFNLAQLAKWITRGKTTVVHGVHNTVSQLFQYGSGPKMWIRRHAFAYLLPFSDRIVAVSQGVAEDLVRFCGLRCANVEVIYNPILFEEILARARQPVSHPFFESTAVPVLIGIGQLAPRKGFGTLLAAFAILRKSTPAKLIILGEGPQRRELEAIAAKLGVQGDISFPGFVENPYAYLSRSSLFVLSSEFEGLGMALVEAVALGIPVVSTDCPSGPAEILENGKLGRLVPVGDSNAMAAAMGDSLGTEIPPGGVRRVLARFSLENAVMRYLALIQDPPQVRRHSS